MRTMELLIVLGLSSLLTGCLGVPLAPGEGQKDLLAFLADGTTREEQVITTLGHPSGVFMSGRILTYRLGQSRRTGGLYPVEREGRDNGWPRWTATAYSLVLVFDDAHVLRQHSLVRVNR